MYGESLNELDAPWSDQLQCLLPCGLIAGLARDVELVRMKHRYNQMVQEGRNPVAEEWLGRYVAGVERFEDQPQLCEFSRIQRANQEFLGAC